MTQYNLPVPTQTSSDVLNQATKSTESTFKLLYFNVHGHAQLIRHILACADTKWEEIPIGSPGLTTIDWPAQKPKLPFRVFPVVWECTKDGTVLELAEAQSTERYLCKKFHLYGKNDLENHKVDQFYTSTDQASKAFSNVVHASPYGRVPAVNGYYKDVLSNFIELHEGHLKKNGSNGHYVGNSTTLADIKTVQLIDWVFLYAPKGADSVPISTEKTPYLLRETVNGTPSFGCAQEL